MRLVTGHPAETALPEPYVDPMAACWKVERPDWFGDLQYWLVEVGLCSWDNSPIYRPHPQDFAVAVAAFFDHRERPVELPTRECVHRMMDRFIVETIGLYEFFETVGVYESGLCTKCGVDDGVRGWPRFPRRPE